MPAPVTTTDPHALLAALLSARARGAGRGTLRRIAATPLRYAAEDWDESSVARDRAGKFAEKGEGKAATPRTVWSRIARGWAAVERTGRKVKLAGMRALSPAKRKKVRQVLAVASAVEHKVMVGFNKARALAEAVAEERHPLPPDATAEQKAAHKAAIDRVGFVLATVDKGLAWTVSFPLVTAVTGGNAAAGKVASLVPVCALAYLAYAGTIAAGRSLVRNPLATIRAARSLVARVRERRAAAHAGKQGKGVVGAVADLLGVPEEERRREHYPLLHARDDANLDEATRYLRERSLPGLARLVAEQYGWRKGGAYRGGPRHHWYGTDEDRGKKRTQISEPHSGGGRRKTHEVVARIEDDIARGAITDETLAELKALTAPQLSLLRHDLRLGRRQRKGEKKGEFADRLADRLKRGEFDPQAEIPEVAPREKPAPKPGKVYNVPTADLKVDPKRFQFKLNTDNPTGTTAELKQVKTFNPDFAGVLAVWLDPADGQTYVVNGHHRHELADRLGHPDLAVRYVEARSAQEARALGALINIAEGRGTATDAAKFMRDMGVGAGDLESRGVSMKGAVARDAAILVGLNDRLFDRLATGRMEMDRALAIAAHLPDAALQDQLFGLIEKHEEKRGHDLPAKVIAEMAREMAATPTRSKQEMTLFGMDETAESLFVHKNELKSFVRGELAREVGDWLAVASKRRAGRVAGAGNVLDVEANKSAADQAEQAKAVYDTLANRSGPIADALNEAAARYAEASRKSGKEAIKKDVLEKVRDAILRELDGAGPAGAVDGGAEGPAGTGGAGARPDDAAPPDGGRGGAGADGLTAAEADAAQQAEAGEGDNNRRVGKDGTVYVRAPAGGAHSSVTDKHYRGGQWMPIHGLSAGQERKPKGQGTGEKPKPPSDEGKGRKRQPHTISAEEAERRREEAHHQRRVSAVMSSPLNDLLRMNPRTGQPQGVTGIGWRPWAQLAERLGEERVRQIADALKPTGGDALLDYEDELVHPQGFAFGSTKKHKREVPSSHEAYAAVATAMRHAQSLDDVERVARLLSGEKAPPAKESHPKPVADALARYDDRDSLPAVAGAMFGGDDARAREGFGKLPDGTEVVVTEGPMRGKQGVMRHITSLDGGKRVVVEVDGQTQPVAHTAVEPLDATHSWRTAAGGHSHTKQGDLLAGAGTLTKGQSEDEKAVSGILGELNAVSRSGATTGTIQGHAVERVGLGRFRVTIGGKRMEGDQTQVANWIHAAIQRGAKQ